MDQITLRTLLKGYDGAERKRGSSRDLIDLDNVTVSKSEYERLIQVSSHFEKLKDSLIDGGLSRETLDVLIHGQAADNGVMPEPGVDRAGQVNGKAATGDTNKCHDYSHETAGLDDDGDDDGVGLSQDSMKEDSNESGRSSALASINAQRTVVLRGLPDWVTYEQIAAVVRGGSLLNIYLRGREHMVNLSFVEESAAQDFLDHVTTHGLRILGKRVDAAWADRQFYLPPYVRSKIFGGASRNLVLHNVNSTITESVIRQDLEHIHNLIVVSVKFSQGNAYISTNSIHNALFARSCMMSRYMYKGMKIGFSADECAGAFPKVPVTAPAPPKTEFKVLPPKKRVPHVNRFQLLSLDGAEEEGDSYEDSLGGLNGGAALNGGINWADNTLSALG